MKTTLLMFILCGIITTSFAQHSYIPFAESPAIWTYRLVETDPSTLQTIYKVKRYKTEGDTVISGQSYQKLYEELGWYTEVVINSTMVPTISSFIYQHKYILCYRNDEATRSVYRINKDSVNENLWYRFNLSIGDTLETGTLINDNATDTIFTITSIDSVYYCGHYRYQYNISPSPCYWGGTNGNASYIEGIGLYPHNFTGNQCTLGEYYYELFHCYEDSYCASPVDTLYACSYYLSSPEEEISSAFHLYPNPASQTLQIEGIYEYAEIIDLTGKPAYKTNYQPTLDVSSLPAGLYFLMLQKDGRRIQQKFIKNE